MKKFLKGIARDLWIVLLDIVAVNAAYFLALMVRLYVNFEWRDVARDYYLPAFLRFAPVYTVLVIIVFMLFRLYGGMWQYAGLNDMNRILGANAITVVIQVVGTWLIMPPMRTLPRKELFPAHRSRNAPMGPLPVMRPMQFSAMSREYPKVKTRIR